MTRAGAIIRRRRAGIAIIAAAVVGTCAAGGTAVAQGADPRPQIRIAPRVLVEVDIETPLMIAIGPTDAVPPNSYVQVRGLPEAATLNEGHNISPGTWAVPLRSLPNLTIQAPQAAAGTTEFVIRVVSVEGSVLGESKSSMIVAPAFQIGRQASTPPPPRPVPAQPQASAQLAIPQPVPAPVPATGSSPRVASISPKAETPIPPPAVAPAPGQDRPGSVLPPEERARLEKMVTLGNRHLGNGNIAAAREFFRRAAEGGLADGALMLATTYDPAELGAIKVQGLSPDPAEAKKWYETARSLGAVGVDARISRLGGR